MQHQYHFFPWAAEMPWTTWQWFSTYFSEIPHILHPISAEVYSFQYCLYEEHYSIAMGCNAGTKGFCNISNPSATKQTYSDPHVCVNKDNGVIIAMCVDDLIIFGINMARINDLKAALTNEYEMKDLGELKCLNPSLESKYIAAKSRHSFISVGQAILAPSLNATTCRRVQHAEE